MQTTNNNCICILGNSKFIKTMICEVFLNESLWKLILYRVMPRKGQPRTQKMKNCLW